MTTSKFSNDIVAHPQHLEAYFMRRKQDKLIQLTKFVKRYYVF
jgi:hypothetical protein